MEKLYKQFLQAGLQAGLPMISTDTAAKVLAIIYVHGNNEQIVYSPKLKADIDYIQEKFNIHGGGKPTRKFSALLRSYIDQLETYENEKHEKPFPEWAESFFKDKYHIQLM